MSDLRKYLQEFINDLQESLNEHSDDKALLAALAKKWPDEDEPRSEFIFSVARQLSESADKVGTDTGDTQENVLVRKKKI